MNGTLYIIKMGSAPLGSVIREKIGATGQAEWKLVRNATPQDVLNIKPHPYFKSTMVPA